MIGLPTTITRRDSEPGVGREQAICYEPRRGGVFVGEYAMRRPVVGQDIASPRLPL